MADRRMFSIFAFQLWIHLGWPGLSTVLVLLLHVGISLIAENGKKILSNLKKISKMDNLKRIKNMPIVGKILNAMVAGASLSLPPWKMG